MKGVIGYFHALLSPQFAPTGIKVAVVVGTILLTINHGYAIVAILITDLSFFSDRSIGIKQK
ncbi:MAG: nitrate/nitrite transporter NrtS [Microcystis sp.]